MDDPRFAAAEAAFKANREQEGIELLAAALGAAPGPVGAYRNLAARLFQLRRFAEAEQWSQAGISRAPKDFELWNILGVALRRLNRPQEALKALDTAHKINPKALSPLTNKLNVLNDIGDGAAGVEVGLRVVRAEPGHAELQRCLGLAYRNLGQYEAAASRFDTALRLNPKLLEAWIDRANTASVLQKHEEALAVTERGLKVLPGEGRLLEQRVFAMRRGGRPAEAEALLRGLLAEGREEAWIYLQLARTIQDANRPEANAHYRRAVELEPNKLAFRTTLADSLDRSRYGDEGAHIEEAYQVLKAAAPLGIPPLEDSSAARGIAYRVGDYELAATYGSVLDAGRAYARAGSHGPLLLMLAQAKSPEDRLELLEIHRIWGRVVSAQAARNPIKPPPRRPKGGKIRLGLLSSDLRNHPVGYFAVPLFQHLDAERFELYAYSFSVGPEDPTQKFMTSKATAFRWRPHISDRDAAQMIADDQLDMLIELGGSTYMNKPAVMAYKPAPIQASWLGYPHSLGLNQIDYLVVDPYIQPEQPGLLIEKPLPLRKAWYPLSSAFKEDPAVAPEPPCRANGYVTFGTANNPYKYSPEGFDAWGRIMAATPDSRFLFIRPEGSGASFRANAVRQFAKHGVAADRVLFEAVRGSHMSHYNRLDISLDPFPQTGGTTTLESLWMGVPVVTLVGPSPFERLSYSTLENVGLPELCAFDVPTYIDIAVKLAGDTARIADLRAGMRQRLRASPLGNPEQWAKDFYDVMAEAVAAR